MNSTVISGHSSAMGELLMVDVEGRLWAMTLPADSHSVHFIFCHGDGYMGITRASSKERLTRYA
jgi:hypothetical protein